MFRSFIFFALILLFALSCVDSSSNHSRGVTSADPNTAKAVYASNAELTAGEVVERIKGAINCDWREPTVDTFKGGSSANKITGIATTFLANVDVLKRAKAQGLNFIITHEPTYYNHHDKTDMLEGDPVYLAKKKYIEDNGLVVWRFHDHWHYTEPDGIHKGMIENLGWTDYQIDPDKLVFHIPEISLRALAKQLNKLYNSNAVRVTGNPDLKIKKAGLVVGSPGYLRHLEMLRSEDIQVILIGEANEWETVEYVRDAIGLGKEIALISLGHANSEEGGMAYCAEWLKDIVKEVPIKHVPAGDPYWTAD